MRHRIGTRLNRYLLLELLGEGGMGAVFKARDETLQRTVALKVLHPHFASQPSLQERFLREARAAAALDHPGIVKVFDFGKSDELLYIVMEFIPGSNLRELMNGWRAKNRWLPLPLAVELGSLVCQAIEYAHRQGVLHRDIKPENIMLKLGQPGSIPYRPVLTDLGLARLLDEQSITQVGESMGTPAYMSPEQAMGEATDARSDVYSLGILLFELLTGQVPFPAKTITEAIRYHTREPLPRPTTINAQIPSALEAVIMRALEKAPGDRFPDAGSLWQALERSLIPQQNARMETMPETQRGTENKEAVTVITETLIDQSEERNEVSLPDTSKTIKSERISESEHLQPAESVGAQEQIKQARAFHCVLSPEETLSGRMVTIHVDNPGDEPQAFAINFQDQSETVFFDPPEIDLQVSPGKEAAEEFVVEELNTYWYGPKQICPYSVVVQSNSGQTKTLAGRVIRRAAIPIWSPLVLLSIIVLVWWRFPPQPNTPGVVYTVVPVQPTMDPWKNLDNDGDGLTNGQEQEYGLDPERPLGGGTGWLAFQRSSNDQEFILKTTVGGNQLVQLSDEVGAYYPNWSPDGRQIAFLKYATDTEKPQIEGQMVHVMDSEGGNIRMVSNRLSNNSRPSWSPDITRIIDAGLGGLYSVDVAGVDFEEIDVDFYISNPDWSPDGQLLAFMSRDGDRCDIISMAIDGSNLKRLTTAGGFNTDPDWSPDGKQIAFASGPDWGSLEIYIMNADGTNLEQLTQNSRNDWSPAWSPDGEWIAFSGDGEIYVIKSDGSLELKVTNKTAEDNYSYPTWQPLLSQTAFPTIVPLPDDDGDGLSNSKEVDLGLDPYTPLGGGTGWIAFQTGVDSPNVPHDIYKITIGGKNLTQLTDAPPNEAPMWSPNGEKIAFTSGRDSADHYSLYVMDSDGQNVTGLTATWDTGADPSWSPDSLRISYRKMGNLYSIQLDGSDENLDADLGIGVSDPQVSPDGKSVVFLSWGEDENRDIYRMDIDGRNLTRLTTDPAWDGFPNWSPDGEEIAFASTRDGDNEIFLMNDDGSNQRQLTDNSVSDITPAWSPDGQWIAYSSGGNIRVGNMDGTIDFWVTTLAGKEAYPTWQPILAAKDPTYLEPTPTLESGETEKKPTYVLWDLSHGPRQSESGVLYEPDGLYSQLKSELESQNIILVSNREPLEQVNLDPYAMIVIAMTSAEKQNFTVAEAQIIGEFVKRGGSLLILAERPGFPNRIREVTGYYDIDVGQQLISEVTRLEDHPIFTNIDGLYFEFDGGSINVRNRDAQVIASDNSLAAVVVIDDLPGRVVVVGDSNLFDNRGFGRNRQFAIRLFRWLT